MTNNSVFKCVITALSDVYFKKLAFSRFSHPVDTETKFPVPDEPVRKKVTNIFRTPLHDECNIQKS